MSSKTPNKVDVILEYLQHRLPAYPFDAETDKDFVEELVADFGDADVLEQIKSFRWFNDSQPVSHLRSVRLTIRRWISNSKKRSQRLER